MTSATGQLPAALAGSNDLVWFGSFISPAPAADAIVYDPFTQDWFVTRQGKIAWASVGNTTGFGSAPLGCALWTGNFTGSGHDDVVFYYPGDRNWWIGQCGSGQLTWSLAGNTTGFGQVWDGRPFWTGNFTGGGNAEILFYYPGGEAWWLGTFSGTTLNWTLADTSTGFGNTAGDPTWIGDFSGGGKDQVLFYASGGEAWWLGTFNGTALSWTLADTTVGFGNTASDPTWIGDFSGGGKDQVLFYSPGDQNWWLGTFNGTALSWALAGNTAGFGDTARLPTWIGDFSGGGKDQVMFFYPGDQNWWLGTFTGTSLSWTRAGNGVPGNLGMVTQHQQQTEWCWSATSVGINLFYDPASTWTQCTLVNKALDQTTCCTNGSSSQCDQPWYISRALPIVGNFAGYQASAATTAQVDSQISAGHPLGVGISWSGGGGHAVAVDGCRGSGTGQLLSVRDPWYGDSWVSYSTFSSSYQGSGSWVETDLTQS